jgi:hypothetical protein
MEPSVDASKMVFLPFLLHLPHASGLQARVQAYIVRKFLGELPAGSAFVLRQKGPIRHVIVVALTRVLTPAGDSMALLLSPPFSYTPGLA